MRLRQLVLVAEELEPLASQLQDILALGDGYHDPNIIHFGLDNFVLPVGDTFLEIVAPVQEETAAGRYLERRGPGGYMVLVQVPDIRGARQRLEELGMRVVWSADHDEISGTHIHPKDSGGAILSLDEARPPASWHWAGPEWQQHSGETSRVCRLVGGTLQSPNPKQLAERWAALCGRPVEAAEERRAWKIALGVDGDTWLEFVGDEDGRGEGLSGFTFEVADRGAILEAAERHGLATTEDSFELGGVRFTV